MNSRSSLGDKYYHGSNIFHMMCLPENCNYCNLYLSMSRVLCPLYNMLSWPIKGRDSRKYGSTEHCFGKKDYKIHQRTQKV